MPPAPRFKITAEGPRVLVVPPGRATRPCPTVQDADWPRSPIDRFVLAKLEEKGLRPVAPADKRTLIRRVTFDLIGLPPTPEEVEAFLADDSPDAFAKVVDRLLASPHYGERWARHWLDVARYGEDQAHTFQARKYPDGYRYRDWVVKAFNADLPYDRFVTEQIAADLLDGPDRADRLAALGLLRPRPGLLRHAQAADELRRPHRHADPRLPRPDGRLRPLPRPQVRPDPDRRTTTRWPASSPAPTTRSTSLTPDGDDRRQGGRPTRPTRWSATRRRTPPQAGRCTR